MVEQSDRRDDQAPAQTSEVPYYDLWTKPFRENTDPHFLWLGPQYRDAFATLRAAVLQNVGVLLLTGEVGTGKTMLASALVDGLRAEGVRVAKLAYAGRHPNELWSGVAQALELPGGPHTRESLLAHVGEFARGAYARREKVLLVIDEAQNLGAQLLEEIDHLVRAGREAGRGKVNVVNVLLVGQTGIDALLRRQEPHTREDLIAVRSRIGPLSAKHVADYIASRLRVAGADRELFSAAAIRQIAAASRGVPRLINRICDRALLVASQRNERVVSANVVGTSMDDLGLAAENGGRQDARGGKRRIAYAAAIALAIGLGAVLHVGRANNVGHGQRPEDLRPSTSARGAADEPAATVEPAATTPPRGEGAADQPKAEMVSPAGRRAASAPSAPRADATRLPKTPASEPLLEPAKRTRPDVATRDATPARAGTRPAIADRSREESRGPSSVGAPPRPAMGHAEQTDDPGAIINWLLQGNRPGVER